jgi:hypothetical protein
VPPLIKDGILLFVGFFVMGACMLFFLEWLEPKCQAITENAMIKILVKNFITVLAFFSWAFASTKLINVILKKDLEFNKAGITGIFIYVSIFIVTVSIQFFQERRKTRRSSHSSKQ